MKNTNKKNTIKSGFWKETARDSNEFYPEKSFCHNREFYSEITGKLNVSENIYFLMKGNIPDKTENELLDLAMVSVSNPGPRSFECRAAMNSAIGHGDTCNWLQAGIGASGGTYRGSKLVENSVNMFAKLYDEYKKHPEISLNDIEQARLWLKNNDSLPGFDLFYGEIDHRAEKIMSVFFDRIKAENREPIHDFFCFLKNSLAGCDKIDSITLQGVFSLILFYLGFKPQAAAGIYLIAVLPGILAHSLEQYPKNWNEYPFWWGPEYYIYERNR